MCYLGRHAHERRLLAELKTLHPRLIDLSLGRIEGLLAKLGNPAASACRRSSMSPAPTARARSRPSSRPCWRPPASACTSTPRRTWCASTSASSSPAPTARRARSARPSWSSCCSDVAARQCRRPDHVLRDHHGGGLAGLRRASRRCRASWRSASAAGSTPPTSSRARRSPSSRRSPWITPTSSATTLAKIACEKAGILKPGVPAVDLAPDRRGAGRHPRTRRRRARAAHRLGRGLRGLRAARPARLPERGAADGPAAAGADGPAPDRQCRHGHRRRPASEAARHHRTPPSSAACIEVRWPARMQRLDNGPLARLLAPGSELWLDGGHNPAGGAGHRADAGRAGGAGAQAGRPRARHDGPQGCRGLPGAFPRAGAPHRHRADPGAPEAAHEPAALAAIAASRRLHGRAAPRCREPPSAACSSRRPGRCAS